jgi:replicative superfamily II helicase
MNSKQSKVKITLELSKDHYDFMQFYREMFYRESTTLEELLSNELERTIESVIDVLGDVSELKHEALLKNIVQKWRVDFSAREKG